MVQTKLVKWRDVDAEELRSLLQIDPPAVIQFEPDPNDPGLKGITGLAGMFPLSAVDVADWSMVLTNNARVQMGIGQLSPVGVNLGQQQVDISVTYLPKNKRELETIQTVCNARKNIKLSLRTMSQGMVVLEAVCTDLRVDASPQDLLRVEAEFISVNSPFKVEDLP